jgi:hypothetical protein
VTNSLPVDGETDWGDALNAYITNVAVAGTNQTATNLALHEGNSPTDPHGDRAYAASLMLPITQNVNQAGGFVQLTTGGLLPASVTPTPDTWHDLRPVGTAFAMASGQYPPQYRQTLDGGVRLAGFIATTATGYNGALAFANALPVGVRPAKQVILPVTVSAAGSAATLGTAVMTIATSGFVTLSGLPTGLATGTLIGLYGWYPLDASYSLIES